MIKPQLLASIEQNVTHQALAVFGFSAFRWSVDMFVATWRRNIATQMDFVALCDAQIERNRKS